MTISEQCLPVVDYVNMDRLGHMLAGKRLSLDLVSAFAGDRPMTDAERDQLGELMKRRGKEFFPDLLFAIAHENFSSLVGEDIWNEILRHKTEMSGAMRRNVRIAVAALDYLSNLKGAMTCATLINESQVADIAHMAFRDGLTNLFNHTTCFQKLETELRIFRRFGRLSSLMMIDIDDFKKINDQYGHRAGDRVLAAMGVVVASSTRVSDICCRYGGEEFSVILPGTPLAEAGLMAERLRSVAEKSRPDRRRVTVSIGVAVSGTDTPTPHALVEKADGALYEAKRAGKNRVVVRL
ncbi:MAG: GGDEF domain-containing protein [Kiritimatiellia bacterium]